MHTHTYICIYYITEIHHSGAYGYSLFLLLLSVFYCVTISLYGEGNGNPLQYPCLEIPWTEEPGGLQSTGSQESDTT